MGKTLGRPATDKFVERVRGYLLAKLEPKDARNIIDAGLAIPDVPKRHLFFSNLICDVDRVVRLGRPPEALPTMVQYKRKPVDIRTFVCDPYYLDMDEEIYPAVMDELEIMNSGLYQEVVLTGGIGSAKTTCALISTCYQLYLLSCLKNPHLMYGLQRSSEILFVFQSINKKVSTSSYNRFKSMVEESKYFAEHFPFNRDLSSKLVFPNRIEVVPISGAETAAIGQNVMGGMIDELNYMQVTQKSKQSADGGTYDQAVALYNSIARRRKSRFMSHGKMPGLLCLVSSKRYPGQFTDLKEEESQRELKKTGMTTIYVYDKRVWDVKPEGSFTGERFWVFIGDESRKPRIEDDPSRVRDVDRHLLMQIPVEFLEDFRKDIINALREIAGVSTLARHPYMVNTDAVASAFGRVSSVFSREDCDFVQTKVAILPKRFVNPHEPRWAHIDLAINGDHCGLAIGHVSGFKSMMELGIGRNAEEMMPMIHIDGVLDIHAPRNGEILFWKVRDVLTKLRGLGLNIRWVSFDSYQSRDSMQLLRQQGFIVGEISVDVTNKPYDYAKSAFYTGRIVLPAHPRCQKEFVSLERDTQTGKIDHPPNGSKDCSDGVAGVVYGLTTRREIWGRFSVPTMRAADSIRAALERDDEAKPKVT
jgi:hypothetical protein